MVEVVLHLRCCMVLVASTVLKEVQHGLNDSDFKYLVTGEMPHPRKCRRLCYFGIGEETVATKAYKPHNDRLANRAVASNPSSDCIIFVLECGVALAI